MSHDEAPVGVPQEQQSVRSDRLLAQAVTALSGQMDRLSRNVHDLTGKVDYITQNVDGGIAVAQGQAPTVEQFKYPGQTHVAPAPDPHKGQPQRRRTSFRSAAKLVGRVVSSTSNNGTSGGAADRKSIQPATQLEPERARSIQLPTPRSSDSHVRELGDRVMESLNLQQDTALSTVNGVGPGAVVGGAFAGKGVFRQGGGQYSWHPAVGWAFTCNLPQVPTGSRVLSSLLGMSWARLCWLALVLRLATWLCFTAARSAGHIAAMCVEPPVRHPLWESCSAIASSVLAEGWATARHGPHDWHEVYQSVVEWCHGGLHEALWVLLLGVVIQRLAERPSLSRSPVALSNVMVCHVDRATGRPCLGARGFVAGPPYHVLGSQVQLLWQRRAAPLKSKPGAHKTCPSLCAWRTDALQVELAYLGVTAGEVRVVHDITEQSPLYGKTHQDLAALGSVFQVSILSTNPSTGETCASAQDYPATAGADNAVKWGRSFQDLACGEQAVPPSLAKRLRRQMTRADDAKSGARRLEETVPRLDLGRLSSLGAGLEVCWGVSDDDESPNGSPRSKQMH